MVNSPSEEAVCPPEVGLVPRQHDGDPLEAAQHLLDLGQVGAGRGLGGGAAERVDEQEGLPGEDRQPAHGRELSTAAAVQEVGPEPKVRAEGEVPAVEILQGGQVLVLERVQQEPLHDRRLADPLRAHDDHPHPGRVTLGVHVRVSPTVASSSDWWAPASPQPLIPLGKDLSERLEVTRHKNLRRGRESSVTWLPVKRDSTILPNLYIANLR